MLFAWSQILCSQDIPGQYKNMRTGAMVSKSNIDSVASRLDRNLPIVITLVFCPFGQLPLRVRISLTSLTIRQICYYSHGPNGFFTLFNAC